MPFHINGDRTRKHQGFTTQTLRISLNIQTPIPHGSRIRNYIKMVTSKITKVCLCFRPILSSSSLVNYTTWMLIEKIFTRHHGDRRKGDNGHNWGTTTNRRCDCEAAKLLVNWHWQKKNLHIFLDGARESFLGIAFWRLSKHPGPSRRDSTPFWRDSSRWFRMASLLTPLVLRPRT